MAKGTTIADKLENLTASKANILAALTERGLTLPSDAKLEDVADLIRALPQGEDVSAYEAAWSLNRRTMTALEVPEGITSIGDSAFYNCPELRTLTLPSTLRTIGSIAFNNCQKLTALNVPEGVTEIGGGAFNACYGLATLRLPASVTTLGSTTVFQGCPTSCDVVFGRPVAEVKAMCFHPWGLKAGTVIHCTDGDLTV